MVDVFRPFVGGKKSTYYYGKVRDPETRRWKKVSLMVTDKQVARQKLRELQERAERVACGMEVPALDSPVTDLLAAFLRHLEHEGAGLTYRLQTECEIIKFALFAAGREVPVRIDRGRMDDYRSRLSGVKLKALTSTRLDSFLDTIPADRAARTRNGYRTSVIGLFSFLVGKGKLQFNPMLSATRHEGPKKRKRRALPADQLQRLFDAARRRPLARTLSINRGPRKGERAANVSPETRRQRELDGRQRALIYMTAFYTGFRRKELRSMCVKHLRLQAEVPHVFLPGELTKNGEDASIPLRAELAGLLREWIAGRGTDDPVFDVPRYDELLKALKKDLEFADIPYRDELGRVFDFHSLRKSLGTALRQAKVDPAVSQKMLRHADIRLTMQVYNDDELHDLNAEAVSKLPRFDL